MLRREIIFRFRHALLIYSAMLCVSMGTAQGRKEDYARAGVIREAMENNIYSAPKFFGWVDGQNQFWYLNQVPKGKEFVVIDPNTKSRRPAFDQVKLASRLSQLWGKNIDAFHLPFTSIFFPGNTMTMEFDAEDKRWRVDLQSYECRQIDKVVSAQPLNRTAELNEQSAAPVPSPDGQWNAFIREYNVWIQSNTNKKEIYQLSFDGAEGDYYSSSIQWAPDSKKLATNKILPNKQHLVYLIESSPEDQVQPKLHARNYLKPGDALPQKRPSLFLLSTKKQIAIDPFLISNQYSLSNPVWRKDSRSFTFEYNQRGHQTYKVMEMEATAGRVKDLIKEEASTFINIRKKYRYDVADGKEIIWASERDGWNHLYLIDGESGTIKNQITKGNWIVRNVIQVDEQKRTIVFEGSGREPGQDPYLIQLYRVNFDGTGLQPLTTENANHTTYFSADYSMFIDSYSRIDLPTTTVLRSAADGKVLMELEKAEIKELLRSGWKMPEVFSAKGRDGKTDIWGIIVRPSHFDPKKKYPVIEYIYGGPHSSFVPKSFISDPQGGDYRPWTELHELAELGFIVVQIDGMGTQNRSKAFHDVCWKNLKDGGFPDRIGWIREAAGKYRYMDIDRVGIFGNSAGGQNSVAAMLLHPDFYKVAVSSSGCHDNRMDKIGWNEQWMGYPVGPEYAESSNVTHAHKLKGDLLLILGEMDENVPPESTLQLVNALIKANKKFDFLLIPGMGHSLGGEYGEHKRRDFFVKHLLGVEPPQWEGQSSIMETVSLTK